MTRDERFWSKVDTTGGLLACWPWTGGVSSSGYGSFDHEGAHRISLAMALGRPLGQGMHACHNCPDGDNPLCVNPAHLFEGTGAENVADRQAKGRTAVGDRNGARLHRERMARGDRHHSRLIAGFAQGERNGRAQVGETEVRLIRELAASGVTRPVLAERFGLSVGAVKHIVARRTWQHTA